MNYKEFYSELGKLLYAIAASDKAVSKTEKAALINLIKKDLIPLDASEDSYGTDLANYSEMEFDFLDNEISDVESAFESFINFIEEHHTAINHQMVKTSLRVAKKLADSYYGTNKKEKALIEKLEIKLEAIQRLKEEI